MMSARERQLSAALQAQGQELCRMQQLTVSLRAELEQFRRPEFQKGRSEASFLSPATPPSATEEMPLPHQSPAPPRTVRRPDQEPELAWVRRADLDEANQRLEQQAELLRAERQKCADVALSIKLANGNLARVSGQVHQQRLALQGQVSWSGLEWQQCVASIDARCWWISQLLTHIGGIADGTHSEQERVSSLIKVAGPNERLEEQSVVFKGLEVEFEEYEPLPSDEQVAAAWTEAMAEYEAMSGLMVVAAKGPTDSVASVEGEPAKLETNHSDEAALTIGSASEQQTTRLLADAQAELAAATEPG